MTTAEHQPDLLSGAKPPPPKRAAAKKQQAKAAPPKKAGTAVAVDDPKKRQQQVAEQQPSTLLAAVIRASMDPACDPAKMRELIAIQREIEDRDAKIAFDEAFVALQTELPSIRRDRKIEIRKDGKLIQSTPYATFENMHQVIQPLLTKYGFGLSFSTEPGANDRLIVRTTLFRKGHSISTAFPLPAETSGSKNNVQGWGSSQSYGKRYGMIALLNIVSHAPEDVDTDGRTGDFKRGKDNTLVEAPEDAPKISRAQRDELVQLMTDARIGEANFCAHYGVAQVGFLPAALFAAAKKEIAEHVAKRGKK